MTLKRTSPVAWMEGMFLRPHHLQQYDLFLESRDIAYLGALEHFGWGLIHLELEKESLNNFVLGVKSLRAVLPGGTLVDVPGNARLAPCQHRRSAGRLSGNFAPLRRSAF